MYTGLTHNEPVVVTLPDTQAKQPWWSTRKLYVTEQILETLRRRVLVSDTSGDVHPARAMRSDGFD